jgi:hypothetical protein
MELSTCPRNKTEEPGLTCSSFLDDLELLRLYPVLELERGPSWFKEETNVFAQHRVTFDCSRGDDRIGLNRHLLFGKTLADCSMALR